MSRKLVSVLLATLTVSTVLAPRASAAGTEYQVNTYTTNIQTRPDVAVDGAGSAVFVWVSVLQDGFGTGVYGQRFDAAGLPVGGEFQVNTFTTMYQAASRVSAASGGNFVVAWSGAGSASSNGVFARRYDSAGLPLGGEFLVNTYTTGGQGGPDVASDGGGNFVVVWESFGQDGDVQGIFGQRFDSAGLPLGGEFQVNTYTTGEQRVPAVAIDGTGDFLVVWQSGFNEASQDGSYTGIFAQRYDGAGLPLGGEFQVNTYTTNVQSLPDVAGTSAGGFVVVWQAFRAGFTTIAAQRYDGTGLQVGGEFQVETYTTYGATYPAVATDAAGNFVVAWTGGFLSSLVGADGDLSGILAQRFDAAANRVGGEFQVNTYTTDFQLFSRIAASPAGDFVVVWDRTRNVGLYGDIFAQRNKPDRLIRGKQLDLRNPTGSEDGRRLNVFARESPTEVGVHLDGDPTVAGATLRVITHGTTDSDQTYVLDASGWRAVPGGFKYLGPTGGDGDPVARVILKRIQTKSLLRVDVRGNKGTQSLDVVPPNPGDDATVVLQIGDGGGTYCASFGGAAGGTERRDLPERWSIVNATAEPLCPTP